MKLKAILAYVLTLIGLGLPPYAYSAYQYTYTSGPNAYLENTASGSAGLDITSDDLLKVVITSTNLLTPATDLLADATLTFSLGNYSLTATYPEIQPPELNFTDVAITEFDPNNLPLQWAFDVSRVVALEPGNESVYSFESNPMFNLFLAGGNTPRGSFGVIASYANTGNWVLNEISSPVPEVETYAMIMAGLGLIGFVKRRKSRHLPNG